MTSSSAEHFFNRRKNVEEYILMREGLDGRFLIEILKKHVKPKSTLLELGIGPGLDLEILSRTFQVTGSDKSSMFLELYRTKNPLTELIKIDAVTMETTKTFDAIYSNKVLHHLARTDLPISFENQKSKLNAGGILFHSFWIGDEESEFEGLRFVKYQLETLIDMTKPYFDLIESGVYAEMNTADSFYVCLKKRD